MKVERDQVVLVPWLPIFGGDASHGSHRVVVPMATNYNNDDHSNDGHKLHCLNERS